MTKKIDNDQKIYLKYIIFLQQQTLMLSLTEPWQRQTLIELDNKFILLSIKSNYTYCK